MLLPRWRLLTDGAVFYGAAIRPNPTSRDGCFTSHSRVISRVRCAPPSTPELNSRSPKTASALLTSPDDPTRAAPKMQAHDTWSAMGFADVEPPRTLGSRPRLWTGAGTAASTPSSSADQILGLDCPPCPWIWSLFAQRLSGTLFPSAKRLQSDLPEMHAVI
ncbi:hypothetical protein G7Z17_g12252 [Cylindrodendrum hubeiense]|uniref:Uncharacterized protein n=1 Tax=Cylindrodendrum hubeiense TaxID=595255 RepID=A0A9P5H1B3_9HYPO|nr:hypothetical protein G7Z17_g12252 [Cylindrodendrum hubeiense]